MKRIGLTMRIVADPCHGEIRDALAQDWATFLAVALPDCCWIPIPNLGPHILKFAREWGLEGVILTGGNDPGSAPQRDETENNLIQAALRGQLPLFGVCRGLQMIQYCLGGPLMPCNTAHHVGKHHPVRFEHGSAEGVTRKVNSFHSLAVRREDLPSGLVTTAVSADGWVEALAHRTKPLAAVQWHPERNPNPHPLDIQLLREALQLPPFSTTARHPGSTTPVSLHEPSSSSSPCAP